MGTRFSVIIPVYNREELVGRAIRSVLAQSYRDFELLVVDDASTDRTAAVVQSFDDSRLSYIRLPENGGNAVARNAGVRRARGELITFLDSDDEFLPGFLAGMEATFSKLDPQIGFVWAGIETVDAKGDRAPVDEDGWTPETVTDRYLAFLTRFRGGTDHGLTIRRECVEKVGLFDERLRAAVDTDFVLRLVQQYDCRAIPEPLVVVHEDGRDRVRRNTRHKAAAYDIIIEKHREKLRAHPRLWAKFHYKAGWLHYHAGNRAQARGHLLRALRRMPSHAKSWTALLLFETVGRFGPGLHRRLATRRRSKKERAPARTPLRGTGAGTHAAPRNRRERDEGAMSAGMRRSLDTFLSRSPAQPLFRWRASHRLVVLAYHDVQDAANFARQVEYLAGEMHPVSLDEVLTALSGGRPLPRRSVLVTFDDGDRTVLDVGLPILQQWRVPAVAFVIAGLLDTEQPYWWNEARELLACGARASSLPTLTSPAQVPSLKRLPDEQRLRIVEELQQTAPRPATPARQLTGAELRTMETAAIRIGNHTFSHPCLNRCSDAKVRDEITRAHESLTRVLGAAPKAFAYPNGDVHAAAPPVLAELGYEAAFLFDHRVGRFPPADPFAISRVRLASTVTPERFRILLSGLHSAIHRAVGRA